MSREIKRIVLTSVKSSGKRGTSAGMLLGRCKHVLLQRYIAIAVLASLCVGFLIHVYSPVSRTFFIPVIAVKPKARLELVSLPSTNTGIQGDAETSTMTGLHTFINEKEEDQQRVEAQKITNQESKATVPLRTLNGQKKYIIYRSIGNDLQPVQALGQVYANVKFILENEATFPAVEKHWLVNRIADDEYERRIISLLEQHNQKYIHLPLNLLEYSKISARFEGFDVSDILRTDDFREATEQRKGEIMDAMLHDKNLYALNINGARNMMIESGIEAGADWVFPMDDSCFWNATTWNEMASGLDNIDKAMKYVVVPVRRLQSIRGLEETYRPAAREEPQIGFRYDAKDRFNPALRYGRHSKVELLWRLGVSGPWMKWQQSIGDWEKSDWVPSSDVPDNLPIPSLAGFSRLVTPLSADQQPMAVEEVSSEGVRRLLGRLDTVVATSLHGFSAQRLLAWNETILQREREAYLADTNPQLTDLVDHLIACAKESLRHGPFSVVYKLKSPPSGDKHDYYTPSPYYWPSPKGPKAKWIRRDGQRVPGTVLYDKDSENYDRSRLASLFGNTTCLALGWYFTGSQEMADRAALNIRTWFLDKETRMNPSMRYAQIRWGYDNNVGANYGIIETKDLYFLLDAVRLVHRAGSLTMEDMAGLKDWLTQFVQYLLSSEQGQAEYFTANNHGVYYDVQVAAIAAFIDNVELFLHHTDLAKGRILHQFAPDGSLPDEMARKTQLHYMMFALQGWFTLATLAGRAGVDLWQYHNSSDITPALYRGALFTVPHFSSQWQHKQEAAVDMARMEPLKYISLAHYADLGHRPHNTRFPLKGSHYTVKPEFNPHDGIMPYWNLGLSLRELMDQ